MNQNSCVGNMRFFSNEKKKEILFIICQINNINQEIIQTFMFALLIIDFSLYLFYVCFMSVFCLFVTSSLTPEYMEVISNM